MWLVTQLCPGGTLAEAVALRASAVKSPWAFCGLASRAACSKPGWVEASKGQSQPEIVADIRLLNTSHGSG